MKYTPEKFFKPDGNIEAYFNNMGVYKVTVIPQGNSLGHTAMMPEADILSQNKQDLLSFIGKFPPLNYVSIFEIMFILLLCFLRNSRN